MRLVTITLLVLITGMGLFDLGLEVGLRTRPVFDTRAYQEVGCSDIVSNQPGEDEFLVCEVNMRSEDENLRIFRGNGALDDFGRVQN